MMTLFNMKNSPGAHGAAIRQTVWRSGLRAGGNVEGIF